MTIEIYFHDFKETINRILNLPISHGQATLEVEKYIMSLIGSGLDPFIIEAYLSYF